MLCLPDTVDPKKMNKRRKKKAAAKRGAEAAEAVKVLHGAGGVILRPLCFSGRASTRHRLLPPDPAGALVRIVAFG